MEFKLTNVVSLFVVFMLALQTMAQPMLRDDELSNDLMATKRPKYLDTKSPEGFKAGVLTSLVDLVNEGKVNPNVLTPEVSENKPKRGRYMGICVHMTSSGSFVPTPCWKGEGRR